MADALLEVRGLRTHFFTRRGVVKAVDGASFSVDRGETLGIVGESGSGKSMTCLSILRLVPEPGGRIVGGEIVFEGEDLLAKSRDEMRELRGSRIAMILQDPMASLNPALTVGEQIAETLSLHRGLRGRALHARVVDLLRQVRISDPERRVHAYPHQMSGGIRQRVAGAIAISCQPSLLIADEPTTSLDVTIQAQYLRLPSLRRVTPSKQGDQHMSEVPKVQARTGVRDGMRIIWHQPIVMGDGLVLRADVYRPVEAGRYPVILTYGIYAKGLAYQDGYPLQWEKMVADHPEILEGSSNKYQNWETTDPERWVPHGYAVVRVDSRGAGWSPGFMDPGCARETEDLYQCIEWAGTQPWSNGKVGILGISYYASNQWRVAGMHPPHLAAIIPWEGQNDRYRDSGYHGGILSQFQERWAKHQVVNIQYGRGDGAKKNPITGKSVAGPVTLSDAELAKNRVDAFEELKKHPLDDEWHRSRSADLSLLRTPLLTCANWGGQGLHPRGNFNGFTETPADTPKWLEAHGDSHWSLFSSGYGLDLQKRFFDYFLKGIANGWDRQPRVQLNVRHPGERFVLRHEDEWPLARTRWTKLYLDPAERALTSTPLASAAQVEYEALGDGVTFWTPPLAEETEITGPMAAALFVSSSTRDADLFVIVRVFDPDGREVTFMGSTDPNTPIANGWLRASHRRLDPAKSKPYRPYHPHDRVEPLTPGEIYQCDVEIVTSCIVVPAGWRVAFTVRGRDYEYEGELGEFARKFHYGTRGTGGMTHNDPDNRPADVFGGRVTLHAGPGRESYLLLPIIPTQGAA